MSAEKEFVNPIDIDKITESPATLPYAHHVGSALIRPEDKGKIKGRAMAAMVQQTDRQLNQIYKQISLLAEQAKDLRKRYDISEKIYLADMGFEPLIGHTYFLYRKSADAYLLSMLSPEEWGKHPYEEFISACTLLADHTWELANPEIEI
jgi:hypothetical protein